MASVDDIPGLEPERVRQILSDWFAGRATAEVAFIEDTDPMYIEYTRYWTSYEAVFEPSSLDKARVEVWAMPDGDILIGLEQDKRVAQRLGVRNSKYDRFFAAGYETVRINESGLIALLDLIADGQISIAATTVPFFGLISTKALILNRPWVALFAYGYGFPIKWLKVLRQKEFPSKRSVLTYCPW